MKPCVLIPCFNHSATVGTVARAALAHAPVIIVDDGSTEKLPDLSGCDVLRLAQNSGKASALRAGFLRAAELGFTHAITMDADGQHFAEDLPQFLTAAQAQPDAYLVGVRNFREAGCPPHRRRSNAISTFWYRVETGVRLRDTQCGFRCYPLALVQQLKIRSNRYAYELEFMVRAAWVGAVLVAVPVKCTYATDQTGASHFRPVRDFVHITNMNILLVLQSWFVPLSLRIDWSCGRKDKFWHVVHEFFTDNAHEPWPLAAAVGLGLFFGIVPIWGFQMVAAATVAHWLRINKAITLLASNISIPPIAPFIFCAALVLGHWLVTGDVLELSPQLITKETLLEYLGQWLFGSVVLALIVSIIGMILTYGIAWLVRRK
jgi:glycosyltransferase involved in cell wall biosynthesis